MNQASLPILRPNAFEYIKSVTGLSNEPNTIAVPTDYAKRIDDNTPITTSFLDGAYKSLFKDDVWIISERQQINFTTGVDGFDADGILELKTLSYLFLEIPFARAEGLYKRRLAPKTALIRASTLKALKMTNSLKNRSLLSLFVDSDVSNELAEEIQQAERHGTPYFSLIIANLQGILGAHKLSFSQLFKH